MTTAEFQEHVRLLGIPGYGKDEVGFMFETVETVKPHLILDWGTNRGFSARIFYEATNRRLNCGIYTIDLPIELAKLDATHAGAFGGGWIHTLVKQRYGDGVTEALLMWVKWGCPDRSIFFVDGDHSYNNVARELATIARITQKATILLHDTNGPPGDAAYNFVSLNPGWRTEPLRSQAGMIRLVPA